jgi:hypothetical protein
MCIVQQLRRSTAIALDETGAQQFPIVSLVEISATESLRTLT